MFLRYSTLFHAPRVHYKLLSSKDQVSHPYTTTGNITIL